MLKNLIVLAVLVFVVIAFIILGLDLASAFGNATDIIRSTSQANHS